MTKVVCPECHGQGHDVEVTCAECKGSGYDPNEANPVAQCHACSGVGEVEVAICLKCEGSGQVEIEFNNSNTPRFTEDGLAKCFDCGNLASHVLVDYHHNILGSGILFCSQHAFDIGREQCPCCNDYEIDFDGENYLVTYPSDALDGKGCCSVHP